MPIFRFAVFPHKFILTPIEINSSREDFKYYRWIGICIILSKNSSNISGFLIWCITVMMIILILKEREGTLITLTLIFTINHYISLSFIICLHSYTPIGYWRGVWILFYQFVFMLLFTLSRVGNDLTWQVGSIKDFHT